MFYIFAFRSRTNSMCFYEALKNRQIPCSIMNTPREVAVGCGLSVRVPPEYLETAQKIYSYQPLNTFLGIFLLVNTPTGLSVERIMS